MPDAFQTMAPCANDQRCSLLAYCSKMHSCQVIAQWLQSINEIVQVLNFGDRSQTSHSKADTLSHNRQFANTGIKYSAFSMFCLQPCKSLVHIPDKTEIFPKCYQSWIIGEELIKIPVENFVAIKHLWVLTKGSPDHIYFESAFWSLVIETGIM